MNKYDYDSDFIIYTHPNIPKPIINNCINTLVNLSECKLDLIGVALLDSNILLTFGRLLIIG